ncbi:transposon Ty3-I Gag-Pol polyprotein [Hevea brasiliensis]|uniref:transposon Ty3-I Gag-Pol polyprotein n=1 Tax=Hevea brasiliensis TaxID=3981 RepID=UPI0025E3B841|nr:transposon Ty3-I Gag-Pol polyprotein [Hevea brasiliensis]
MSEKEREVFQLQGLEEGEEEWHDVMEGDIPDSAEAVTLSIHAIERIQGAETIRGKDFQTPLFCIQVSESHPSVIPNTAAFSSNSITFQGTAAPSSPYSVELQSFLDEYHGIFEDPKGLPPFKSHNHSIPLVPSALPVNIRPYRYPHFQKTEIEKLVDEMKLNDLTIKDKFPIPIIDDLLDELHGASIFSKIDLKAEYHQIRMNPSDIHKTSFRTHHGHYEFTVMPFGLTNVPATFQALMNHIFQYISQQQLFAKLSKCSFGKAEIDYLGHIISREGVATDPTKIKAVLSWPIPTSVKELRSFLGLTGYYRKFVQHYGIISKPLTDMLKKDAFQWGETAQRAFDHLRIAISQAPVLALSDFNKPFIVETDASGTSMGAVLQQNGHPIAFISKAFGPRTKALSVYERELLAITFAVSKWRHYLEQEPFFIKIDHESIKHLLEQKLHTNLQLKGVSKLLGLQYKIIYRKGVENKVVDALSRKIAVDGQLYALHSSLQPTWMAQLIHSYEGDVKAAEFISHLSINEQGHPLYSYKNRFLFHKDRLYVGSNGGHYGINATFVRLSRHFYWPGMLKSVVDWIKSCDTCARCKTETCASPGLLEPLPILTQAWQHITMDFVEQLPKSQGNDTILVVICRFTKYGHFIPLQHPFTASTVAKLFLDTIFKLHGLPVSIITDRDKIFTSLF